MTPILAHCRDVLLLAGYDIIESRDLQYGWQLRGAGGEVVCVYQTGKIVPQGKGAGAIKALFEANPVPKAGAVAKPKAAPVETVKAEPENQQGSLVPRYPPGWSDEPWDGLTVPF